MMRSIALLSTLLFVGCHGHEHEGCDEASSRDGRRHPDPRHHTDRDDHHGSDHHGSDERCDEIDGAVADPPDAATAAADTGPPTPDAGVNGGCRLDRDCALAGAGLVCEVRSGACVTPVECTRDASCAAGHRCLAGRCLAPSSVCQFATDCGAGRDCVDGRCLGSCSARAACPSTQVCTGGYCEQPAAGGSQCVRATDCAAGSACADGRCVASCDATHVCAAATVCVAGFCQVDTAPRSFCVRDADCAVGSVCRRGSCRSACPGGTATECLRVDVTFDTCGSDLLCTNPLELRPECARSADCAAPTVCVNARCR